MQERERRPGGDIRGPAHGDFTDWDNPEDEEFDDDTPEGYYDEDEDGSYVPGPDDPDYDLSEEAGYAGWEEPRREAILPQWVIVAVSLLLILAIVTPAVLLLD
jgi:hypothetical protein